jgi:RNA polymerase sporulation-specific sigma factor
MSLVLQTLAVSVTDDSPDDQLVQLAREGNDSALDVLLRRYWSYAGSKAKTYFLAGADREDLVQEGMIGLFKAVRDYNPERAASFRSFAEMCITRQIITAVKAASRRKHGPLNSYVSLQKPASDEDSERRLTDTLAAARSFDPVEVVVAADEVAQIRDFLRTILSELEAEVLRMYLSGRSYQDIAVRLDRQAKSIDNALQRIKRKLEAFLRERELARFVH